MYVDPQTVITPKDRVKRVDIIYNSHVANLEGWSWSVALLDFDDEECLGIRWNGSDTEPGKGNPQSHGRATWFRVPDELVPIIREHAEQLANSQNGGLLEGYREMATDRTREAEAQAWCEGLIGDGSHQAR